MSYHGRFENQKKPGNPQKPGSPKKRMNKGLKIFLIVLAVLLVLVAAAAVFAVSYYYKMMNKMNIVTLPKVTYSTEETAAPTQPQTVETTMPVETEPVETTRPPMSSDDIVNILVVGQAAREGEESHLADTTMVVSLNTYTGEATIFSVLRDTAIASITYKDINGRTHTSGGVKFNTVYNNGYLWGGVVDAMAFTNAVMLNDFGVEVDYNVEISFESFIKLIDFMDGVDIELTQAEADYLNKDDVWVTYDVAPGVQRLDGMAALCYARMRKAEGDSDSDIKRTSRQQKILSALLEKVRYMSIPDLQNVANTLLPLITTTMTPNDIASLLLKVLPLVRDLKITTHTIPVENEALEGSRWGEFVDIYGDGMQHSIIRFDKNKNKKFIRAITEAEGIS